MKISRNILVSSMALAGITLGAIAPVTAQAAQTGITVDENGKTTSIDDGNGARVELSKGASAYSTEKTSATAESDANVEVVSGFLSLDAVPDFSFGRAVAGKTANLLNGQSAIPDDGNQEGLLQITESRKAGTDAKDPAANNKGFNLMASLGEFTDESNTSNNGFKLNLMSRPLRSAEDGSVQKSLNSSAVSLPSDGKTAQTVFTATPEDKLMGTYKFVFDSSDSASLVVPDKTSGENAIKKWKGTITWTLNATATGTPTAKPTATPETPSQDA